MSDGEIVVKQRIRIIGFALSILLVILLVITSLTAPDPLGAALDECITKGWNSEDLAVMKYASTGGIFGMQGMVEFQVKGSIPKKVIQLKLQKPALSRRWDVALYNVKMLGE